MGKRLSRHREPRAARGAGAGTLELRRGRTIVLDLEALQSALAEGTASAAGAECGAAAGPALAALR